MLKDILNALKNSDADHWEVTDEKTVGWEFYFIRHRLDQNRVKNVEHIHVTAYRKMEDGRTLGRASAEIAPTETQEETEKEIQDLLFRASLVTNPIYSLNEPKQAEPLPEEEGTLSSVSQDFIETMNSLPETETEDINSYEIFVDQTEKRFLNSRGIDLSSNGISSMMEAVVNARNKDHEIELYRMYHSGTCDAQGLKKDLTRTLQYGRDRLNAVPTPKLPKTAVVFSTEDACRIYDYFCRKLSADSIYQKMSDWQIGTPVFSDIQGDRITLKAVRWLKNSSGNARYDAEGAVIQDKVLMEQDVPQAFWGSRMFSQYLNLKDSFQVSNYAVEGGTGSEEEIRSGRYLEIVEFSDFQVDAVIGDIFGEIRLGYLHDGNSVKIVTGGSVSGNMNDCGRNMHLSKNTVQYDRILIPALTRLENVTISGADES